MKKEKNVYQIIFWVITVLMGLMVASFFLLTPLGSNMSADDQKALVVIGIIMLLVIVIVSGIGIAVYKDASKIGMNPWLWLLIVFYAPNGIGVIIYLVVRHSEKKKPRCGNCLSLLEEDFVVCPKCGHELKSACSNCGKPVEDDWIICPHCKLELTK